MAKASDGKPSKRRDSLASRFAQAWLPLANWRGIALLSVLFVVLYARTLSFGFVFDDIKEVRDNPVLQGPILPGLQMSQHDHQGTAKSAFRVPTHDSYRPLRYLSYQLDAKLFRLAPAAMHAHNVLLGLVGIWLTWWFLSLLALERRIAFALTALFALHPVQVETVAYISARSDLHAGIFALLTCTWALLYLKERRWSWSVGAMLSFFCCMASKEAYVLLPLVLTFVAWQQGALRRALPTLIGLVAVVGVWLAIRAQFVKTSGESHLVQGFAQSGAILRDYVVAFLWPFDSTIVRQVDWGIPWVESGIAGVLVLACFLWWWRTRSVAAGRALLALLWYVLLIGPSILASTIFETLNDHYLYLPLLGLIGLMAQLLSSTWRERPELAPTLSAFFGVWIMAMLAWTPRLIPTWESPRSLALTAIERSPDAGRAWVWHGDILSQEGGCPKALPSYQRAISVDPDYPVGWNNVGVCALRAREFEKARTHTKKAVELEASYAIARMNTGLAEEHLGNRVEACKFFRAAAQLDPTYKKAIAGERRTCRKE